MLSSTGGEGEDAPTQRMIQNDIYEWAASLGRSNNNVVTRNLHGTCHDLRSFDKNTDLNSVSYVIPNHGKLKCYGCNRMCPSTHPVYVFYCIDCGAFFQKQRHHTRDLTGKYALVVGARTKLGHQVMIKLLAAGATVIGTTRRPEQAVDLFSSYPEWIGEGWKARLFFYPDALDLDVPNIPRRAEELCAYIRDSITAPCINIVVFCAAQTIRVREKTVVVSSTHQGGEG